MMGLNAIKSLNYTEDKAMFVGRVKGINGKVDLINSISWRIWL
jgi:hypothetical protein